jgi:hypothetical protein
MAKDGKRVQLKKADVELKRTPAKSKEYVGITFQMRFDEFYVVKELDRVFSKDETRIYRSFLIRCTKCGTERETLAASINSGGCACNNCRTKDRNIKLDLSAPPMDLERKIEAMHEINQIWDEMKRMQRAGVLTKYLVEKYDVNKHLIEEDEDDKPIEMLDDSDDINYDDIDVNWDEEIKKYL